MALVEEISKRRELGILVNLVEAFGVYDRFSVFMMMIGSGVVRSIDVLELSV